MQGNYTTLYLRHSFEFEIPEGYVLDILKLRAYVDDGCIVTLNGQELNRFHVSSGNKTYQSTGENHEAFPLYKNRIYHHRKTRQRLIKADHSFCEGCELYAPV